MNAGSMQCPRRARWIVPWLLLAGGVASSAACSGGKVAGGDAGAAGSPDGSAGDDGGASPTPSGTITVGRAGGTPISPFAFGQNYWDWVDWAGDGVSGVTGTQSSVQGLHLDVLRAGGNNNDANGPPPAVFDHAQLDAFVAYCRSVGAEPILQVPVLADVDGGPATAQTAADMVTYANVIQGYGLRYWEIGNEPDLYASNVDSGVPTNPTDFCATYHAFAAAMRAANAAAPSGPPALTFLGPELSYQYIPGADFLTPFLDACKDDVDIVSIHRYPYSGKQTSISGALGDVDRFKSTVASVSAIVSAHARPNTPLAITEANISYDYQTSAYTPTSLQASPLTFYAGLWTADILGASLQENLWTLAFWDLGDPASAPSLLGWLQSGQPVPALYAQELISSSFHGTTVVPGGVPSGFSAYASYDPAAASTSVLVLNKTTSTSRLAIAVDNLAAPAFDFPALSMTLVRIPDDPTAPVHATLYSQAQADADAGPVAIQ